MTYQWLPSPIELKRSRYKQKGKDGFDHPYLVCSNEDYPMGFKGVDQQVYKVSLAHGRGEPYDMNERKLRVKIRDDFKCSRCGSTKNLQVHHTKGMKSHAMKHLLTLCFKCHQKEHLCKRTKSDGEPYARKPARTVRGEDWEKPL